MNLIVNYLFRALCLLAYAMAAAKLAGGLPAGSFEHVPMVAAVLIGLHAAECLLAFKHVRRYRGPLGVSLLLPLLFGLLHWMPLAKQAAQASKKG